MVIYDGENDWLKEEIKKKTMMEISTGNTCYPFKDAVFVFGGELFENVDFLDTSILNENFLLKGPVLGFGDSFF